MTTDSNINELISTLSENLEPVKRRSPYRSIALWVILSLAYLVGVITYYGPKIDIIDSLQTASFLFEMSIALATFGFAALASSFLSFPDGMQRQWAHNIGLTMFIVLLVWISTNIIEEGIDASMFYLGSCYKGVLVEGLPFVALILLTMKGHSTKPYWLMTMNTLAVTALGWIGLRITCAMHESMLYSFTHYLLPFAILSVVVGCFAQKIFKW